MDKFREEILKEDSNQQKKKVEDMDQAGGYKPDNSSKKS